MKLLMLFLCCSAVAFGQLGSGIGIVAAGVGAQAISDSLAERANDYLRNIDSTDNQTRANTITNYKAKSEIIAFFAAGVESTLITTARKFPMGYAQRAVVIDTIIYIGTSNVTPSSTPKIFYGQDIDAAGTATVTSPSAITSKTTATKVSSFNNGTIPAANMVWLTFTAATTPHVTFSAIILGH
jgi:hypothetical protein